MISVEWNSVTSRYCGEIHYFVMISPNNRTVVVDETRYTFMGLQSSTVYLVSVIAGNNGGNGMKMSISVTTAPGNQ